MRSSVALLRSSWATILSQWENMRRAPPTRKQAETRALLAETIACVDVVPHPPSVTPSPEAKEAGTALLGSRDASTLIWRTLQRQRVPWSETLALFSQQCEYLSAEQARHLRRHATRHPATHARAVLRTWERVTDESLVECLRLLKRAVSVVAYGQIVSSALRSRPELRGVLPVTRSALEHLYDLSTLPNGDSGKKGAPTAAAIALQLTEHLALLQSASLSVRAKETLDARYAALHALTGNWTAALSVVTHSPYVRASDKVAWRAFVAQRQSWAKALSALQSPLPTVAEEPNEQRIRAAIAAAPRWEQALSVLQSARAARTLCDAATAAFLSRSDVSGPNGALNWQEQVRLFQSISPERQTYAQARAVLSAIPPDEASYLCEAEAVLRASATRMYAGTLARRYHGALRNGDWETALTLGLASGGLDLAATVLDLPAAASAWGEASGQQLPAALVRYQCARRLLLDGDEGLGGPASERRAADVIAQESARCTTPSELLGVLLAVALHGEGWRAVKQHPLCAENARLRAYVTARQLQDMAQTQASLLPTDETVTLLRRDVGCFLFARLVDTALVLAWASEKARLYFLKVVPPALRTSVRPLLLSHEVPTSGRQGGEAADAAIPTDDDAARPARNALADPAICEGSLFALAVRSLTSCCAGPLSVCLARIAASGEWGTLPGVSRNTVAFAALSVPSGRARAVQGLDACAAAAAASQVPLPTCLSQPLAMRRRMEAHLLLGQWRWALQDLAQWRAYLDRTGETDRHAVQVLAVVRVCACHAPKEVATGLVEDALRQATLSARDSSKTTSPVQRQIRLLAAVLDLLVARDTRQLEEVVEAQQDALVTQQALSSAFCLLSDEADLSQVLRAAGQRRVGVLDLDDHATQRLLLALPHSVGIDALHTLNAHGRVVHEHWVVELLARSPPGYAAHDVLRQLHVRSSTASAVVVAKTRAKEADLRGFLAALNRLVWLSFRCPPHSGPRSPRPHHLLPYVLTSLVYLLRDILSHNHTVLLAAAPSAQVRRGAMELYHALCRDSHISRALLNRGEGLLTALTTHTDDDEDTEGTGVARAVLLLGFVHRTLARHQRIPVAAGTTSQQLKLCAEACPREWSVALYLFRQLRSPRPEECAAFFTTLAHAPPHVDVAPAHFLIRTFPEQALVWALDGVPSTPPSPRWQQALQLLHARGQWTSDGAEGVEGTFVSVLESRLDALDARGCDAVLKCLQRTTPQHPSSDPAGSVARSERLHHFLVTQLRQRCNEHLHLHKPSNQ